MPWANYCPRDGTPYRGSELSCKLCGQSRDYLDHLGKARWMRILYERQPYEDNHVDKSFLKSMMKNVNVTTLDFWSCVRDSLVISIHISNCVVFMVTYLYSIESDVSINFLLGLDFLLLGGGYFARILMDPEFPWRTVAAHCRSCVMFHMSLFILSPALRTLTKSYSTDTIYCLFCVFIVLHIYFADYGFANGYGTRFTGTVSLNAAIFASVLLASRLDSTEQVFAFMLFAMELFGFSPFLLHFLKKYSETLFVKLAIGQFTVVGLIVLLMSWRLCGVYIFTITFMSIVCPLWLVSSMKYKNEINGPWDEAVPKPNRRPLMATPRDMTT